jgi:arsenate reductase
MISIDLLDAGERARAEDVLRRVGAEELVATRVGPVYAVAERPVPWTEAPPAPDWFLEALVLRALQPRHVLFLCVANSARSQLGEGIGQLLAPDGVKVSSAGSEPTRVRPQAIAVMDEVGVDITGHASKGMDDVERPVDAVITLCAEESCPAWLEKAWRLHWPLPDPAGAGATEEEELDAFRAARDELLRRLGVVFQG